MMNQSPEARFRRELLLRAVAQAAFDLAVTYEDELEYALDNDIVTVPYLIEYFGQELNKHVKHL